MAYKEVSRVEIREAIRQWQTGRGIREIARSTGLARNTIRKYILTVQSCGLVCDGPPPTESQLITLLQLNGAGPRLMAGEGDVDYHKHDVIQLDCPGGSKKVVIDTLAHC